MYLVFARKYRPHTFDDVIGQQHVARTLKNAVRQGRVAHAYLFCGSRGVGKTSMARILAAALNCEDGPTETPCGRCDHCRRIAVGDDLDVMEIDGASNRGIDEVRELRQNAKISPAHSRFKIYYIDEVHMLTSQAFNALLKTLEEPPPHVKFIFSTTDPQQLPDTVKSRCQRFDFRRISDAEIIKHLQQICSKEELATEKGALEAIARAARGGMRDALGALDQVRAFSDSEVKLDQVLTVLGAARTRTLTDMVAALAGSKTGNALKMAHNVLLSGIDLLDFIDQLSEYLRDVLVAKYCRTDDELLAGAIADADTLRRQSELFTPEQLLYMLQILREARLRARRDTTGKLAFELAIIKLSRLDDLVHIQQTLDADTAGEPVENNNYSTEDRGRKTEAKPTQAAQKGETKEGGNGKDRIKNMVRRLQDRSKGNAGPQTPPATASHPGPAADIPDDVPEGISPEKFRQIQDAAGGAEIAGEIEKNTPLLEAFIRADEQFDLRPVKLQKSQETKQDNTDQGSESGS